MGEKWQTLICFIHPTESSLQFDGFKVCAVQEFDIVHQHPEQYCRFSYKGGRGIENT